MFVNENLEDLENLKNLDNWVLWTFWKLICSFRSILSSDLGLNSFESCFIRNSFIRIFFYKKQYLLALEELPARGSSSFLFSWSEPQSECSDETSVVESAEEKSLSSREQSEVASELSLALVASLPSSSSSSSDNALVCLRTADWLPLDLKIRNIFKIYFEI